MYVHLVGAGLWEEFALHLASCVISERGAGSSFLHVHELSSDKTSFQQKIPFQSIVMLMEQ
jgi:hypothetical protein